VRRCKWWPHLYLWPGSKRPGIRGQVSQWIPRQAVHVCERASHVPHLGNNWYVIYVTLLSTLALSVIWKETSTLAHQRVKQRSFGLVDCVGAILEMGVMSRFPLALSLEMKQTRSCTCCGSTHVTLGVNTRKTHRTLTGIRTMKITAWPLDTLSSPDRRG
jgi:hypothetical protein